MAYTSFNSSINNTEQLGSFSGYVRRPKPEQSGMIAQIFGENGEDADTILALSMTKFQDAQVCVSVYIIKDPNGKIMKENNEYPLISQFIGVIRRSQPKRDGMMAQFFAPNGPAADSVSNLSKSDFQDCLVFVDVRGIQSINEKDSINKENIQTINQNYASKITKTEKIELLKKDKQFKKMNEILELSDFLSKIEVLTSLGTKDDFTSWLDSHKTCSHLQAEPCLNNSNHVEIYGLLPPFNYLPCCEDHKFNLSQNEHIEQNNLYYEMKHRLLLKAWAWYMLKQKFSLIKNGEPDPAKIIEWATNRKLIHLLPKKYEPVL